LRAILREDFHVFPGFMPAIRVDHAHCTALAFMRRSRPAFVPESHFMSRFDLGPKPRLGYTAEPVERLSERRGDAEFLVELAARNDAGAYVVCGDLVVMQQGPAGNDPLFALQRARALGSAQEMVFLGTIGDAGRFAVAIDPEEAEALKAEDRLLLSDLRSIAVQGLVAPEHLSPLAEAKAILHWHMRHRFCANCGTLTRAVQGGWRRDCPACAAEHFPRTDPVVIMLAIRGEQCLLGRQSRFPPGMWSCLAGFVEPGETIEAAVRREIREEAGIDCWDVRYFASQPWPFPMSLMIGCHASARSVALSIDRTELEDARWFDRAEVARMLRREHAERFSVPPPIAIAYHLIRAWVEEDVAAARPRLVPEMEKSGS
jgi:NAD+ diphosphatase